MKKIIGICNGRCCCHKNTQLLAIGKKIAVENPDVQIEEAQCLGECQHGPNVRVWNPTLEQNEKHIRMTPEKLRKLILK